MSITRAQAKRLRTLMTRRVTAAIADSWKGSQPPEERTQIEEDLRRAEEKVDTYIWELTSL